MTTLGAGGGGIPKKEVRTLRSSYEILIERYQYYSSSMRPTWLEFNMHPNQTSKLMLTLPTERHSCQPACYVDMGTQTSPGAGQLPGVASKSTPSGSIQNPTGQNHDQTAVLAATALQRG